MRRKDLYLALAVMALAAPVITAAHCGVRCKDCGKVVKKDVLEGVHFDFDRYEIKPEGRKILDADAEILKKDPSLDVSIEGHCDIIGSDEYNQKLSEKRAKAVFDYLVAKGIDPKRMKTIGFGRKKPIVPNDTPENRAKNRRVEIKIIKARP